MDRGIIYPGQVPLETDLLFAQKSSMVGLAKLAAALIGTSTFANGLAVTPNSPAALNVLVAPGEIYSLVNLDGTAYSSIAADTAHQIVKQGISLDQVTLGCAAPGTVGFSINYLIEAAYLDTDGTPVVLPYYNASNPSTAYSGPANAGTTQNTRRYGQVSLVAKAGVAATTGTQSTPSADAGYIGLYVVTVAYGQTQIIAGNISAVAGAPVLPPAGIVAGGFQGNYFNIASAGGTADAITASYTPGIGALSNGMTLYLRASSANATTTPTFTPNSGVVTAKNIVKGAGSPLAAGDIAGAGHWIELQYDLSLDKWVLLNPANGVSAGNFSAPPPIGSSIPNSGAFSTLIATDVFTQTKAGPVYLDIIYSGIQQWHVGMLTASSGAYTFRSKGSPDKDILTLDTSGNLGLGGAPSAWDTGFRGLDVKTSSLYDVLGSETGITFNAYYNGGWKYKGFGGTVSALRYAQTSGAHNWYTASPGTAGNPISFTQTMTLDANGNLTVAGAVAAINLIGQSQTPQNVTASRAFGTTYTNTTGRPIMVHVHYNSMGSVFGCSVTVGGVNILPAEVAAASTAGYSSHCSFMVPVGSTYSCAASNSTLTAWYEIR